MSGYDNYGMAQLLMAAAITGTVIVVFAAVILYNRYRYRKMLMNKIRREWGQEPEVSAGQE